MDRNRQKSKSRDLEFFQSEISYSIPWLAVQGREYFGEWQYERFSNLLDEDYKREMLHRILMAPNSENVDTLRNAGVQKAWETVQFFEKHGLPHEFIPIVRDDGEIDHLSILEWLRVRFTPGDANRSLLHGAEVHHFDPVHLDIEKASEVSNMIIAENRSAHLKLHGGNWSNSTETQYQSARLDPERMKDELLQFRHDKLILTDIEYAELLLLGSGGLKAVFSIISDLKENRNFFEITKRGTYEGTVGVTSTLAAHSVNNGVEFLLTEAFSEVGRANFESLIDAFGGQAAFFTAQGVGALSRYIKEKQSNQPNASLELENSLTNAAFETTVFSLTAILYDSIAHTVIPEPHTAVVMAVIRTGYRASTTLLEKRKIEESLETCKRIMYEFNLKQAQIGYN
ncbi:MAG: hypothetical protein Q8934_19130 [Bacillota bacterium]|nr:hypothetical protein [Bacillota bacterium]